MHHHRYPGDFLRTCRRSAGFTQDEITHLMGFDSRSHLSRVERGKRIPRLEQALRYELLFGVSMQKIVPVLCDKVVNGLWEDIQSQIDTCARSENTRAKRKCEVLRAAKRKIESLS